MIIPNRWKVIRAMFQTTNQLNYQRVTKCIRGTYRLLRLLTQSHFTIFSRAPACTWKPQLRWC
jgi:hypothetical protein